MFLEFRNCLCVLFSVAAGKVLVFWDLKDFPVPEGRSIREIVGSALTREGYKGEVSITAYGESPEDNLESGITFVHRSEISFPAYYILLIVYMYVSLYY